jgi:hypothetical protein
MVNIVYIHRNPLHHNITSKFQTYRWSSYGDIVNHRYKFANNNVIIEMFGGIKNFINIHQQTELDFKDLTEELR